MAPVELMMTGDQVDRTCPGLNVLEHLLIDSRFADDKLARYSLQCGSNGRGSHLATFKAVSHDLPSSVPLVVLR